MRVLLTGGGTAGHINPALAIAELIRQNQPDSEILFVGIKGGKEEDLVPREGYELRYVRAKGIKRSLFAVSNIQALWLAAVAPYEKRTTSILNAFQPDIVIGTGGYACWPIMKAAARRGIPTALHESNAKPGLAVRQLQGCVDRIWINFEATAEQLRVKDRVVHVGNPLRVGFGSISRTEARRRLGIPEGQRFVLSFGGSLGATEINRAAVQMMHELIAKDSSILCMHASGKGEYEETKATFAELGLEKCPNCILTDYIYDMPLRMSAADLVISRAGAMTLSELARLGKASILIPSPHVADNHQFTNAKTAADADAAVLLEESDLAGGALTLTVKGLLNSPEQRRKMEHNIGAFAKADANRLIYSEIMYLIKNKSKENEQKGRT